MVTVTTANLLALATSMPYLQQLNSLQTTGNQTINFVEYHKSFTEQILGNNPTAKLLSTQSYDAFHEAGVFFAATNSSYISSNYASLSNPINTTIYNFSTGAITSARYPGVGAPNGGTLFIAPDSSKPSAEGGNGLEPGKHYYLIADEGLPDVPSQLVAVDPQASTAIPLLTSYRGRNFSSLNDVKQHPRTGALFFTDAAYGYFQAFRPAPTLPMQVYRFDAADGDLAVVADGFDQPNGVELSPDARTLYVTDSGASTTGAFNGSRPATVYAFDLSEDGRRVGPRRVFAFLEAGIPDGIHTDVRGNVYVAANGGQSVNVYSPAGVLLGQILVQNSAANFEFVKGGMLLLNADRLWMIGIKAVGREIYREYGTA